MSHISPNISPNEHFTRCYKANADAIFHYCLIRVSDKEQAIDITEETFARLWKTLEEGTEVKNDRAFLFTVAHRLIIDWYRKKKAVTVSSQSREDSENGEDSEHDFFLGDSD